MSGAACGYTVPAADGGDLSPDGRWTARASADTAPLSTRIVVRRPVDAAAFSGVVLVEWLNVTSGLESDPDWAFLYEEILRCGHAYVAVSAQSLGVNGGRGRMNPTGPEVPGLRAENPVRYGRLSHPGDRYSFDLFRQVGQVLRDGGGAGGGGGVLGDLRPSCVLAVGESQSAFYLTTYLNAVHPRSPVFDGFFVHSRGAGIAPLDGGPIDPEHDRAGIQIRSDGQTPVLVLQTEGDLLPPLSYWRARQPDSEWIRTWEVAGTSHADDYLIGPAAPLMGCDWRINEGPQRYVVQAAVQALIAWCTAGTAAGIGVHDGAQIGGPCGHIAGRGWHCHRRSAHPGRGRPGGRAERGRAARTPLSWPGAELAGRLDDAAERGVSARQVRRPGRLSAGLRRVAGRRDQRRVPAAGAPGCAAHRSGEVWLPARDPTSS